MPRLPDGTEFTTDDSGNINSVNGQPANRLPDNRAPGTGGGGKANANESQQLNFVDYGGLVAPFIDFQDAFDFALGVGRDNRDTYYTNLTNQRSKDAALGLVDTDILGIQRGLDQLIPRARSEGNQDTETNIARGGRLDQFNFSRIPGFNTFNRQQVQENNQFNRAEREKSIAASGLDYRGRITKILDQLSTQSEGRMSDPLLDTLITRTNRDRGADIGAASGISGFSGAGINIQDKLDVNQRIGLALDAQKTLPSVLTQGQSVLQPPEEQLRSTLATPTNIPLNVSNIGDRVPIQSNISAGNAQQAIGTQATNLEVIPATTALGSRLQTDQFNEQGRYNRDLTVLDRTQGQLTAQDSEDLRAGLQDKADQYNQQQLDAYYAGLDARKDAAQQQALAGFGSAALGFATSPTGQSLIGDAYDYISGLINPPVDTSGQSGFGTADLADMVLNPGGYSEGPIGDNSATTAATGGQDVQAGGGPDIASGGITNPNIGVDPGSGSDGGFAVDTSAPADNTARMFKTLNAPLPDVRQDLQTVSVGANTIDNWNNFTPQQQIQASANFGTNVALSTGTVTPERGRQIQTANSATGTLLNSDAPVSQRAAATAQLGVLAGGTSYGGSVNNPTTIGNIPVTGPTVMPDGSRGFLLEDGSAVPQADLVNSANATSAVNAFSIVTSRADNETKLAALTSTGMSAAAANQIIGQVAAGNTAAALSIFATGKNFGQMNPVEQSANIALTTNATYSALANSGVAGLTPNTGASVLGYTAPSATSVAAAAPYVGLAALTAQKINDYAVPVLKGDMKYKDALVEQFPGAVMINEAVGGGGGHNKGRNMRDAWRSNLQAMNIADDDFNVTLADGSKYDIGKDDDAKLVNSDGVERNTFDIDWGNKVAVESIPDAHLFAIATGLDPTDSAKADTFHRVTAQGVNAATSNAKSYEQSQANFKTMMKDFKPEDLSTRIETLRLTNKITDQEYGVYIDRINKLYGTEFQPQDRQKAQNTVIADLKQAGENAPAWAKDLLKTLTNQRKLESNRRRLDDRTIAV